MSDSIDAPSKPKYQFKSSSAFFIGLLAATGLVGVLVAKANPLLAWLLTMALMAAVVIAAGYNIKNLYFGFLIDRRNRYSLSRLQILIWTLLVLSAYLTAAFVNIRADAEDALAVAIPHELWVLMGISVTSLLGSPLLMNQRRSPQEPRPATTKKTAPRRTARKTANRAVEKKVTADGEVVEYAEPWDATWSDLFKGETKGSDDYLDISRVQMFFFTFILVIAYGYYLGRMFFEQGRGEGFETIESLPAISGGMLALLGISHSAYLGNKAIPSRRQETNK